VSALAIRTFVAVELEPAALDQLAALSARLRQQVTGVRWVRPEGLHLTLRFLGPSSPDRLARLEPTLERAAATCPQSEAQLGGLGMFPERGRPRVLRVGIDVEASVLALQQACERAAVAAGFPPESRPFHPHLTLGRFKHNVPRPGLHEPDLGRTPLRTLTLFQSELTPSGAVYTPLKRCALGI
jgi:2'-5' RNA ligase